MRRSLVSWKTAECCGAFVIFGDFVANENRSARRTVNKQCVHVFELKCALIPL